MCVVQEAHAAVLGCADELADILHYAVIAGQGSLGATREKQKKSEPCCIIKEKKASGPARKRTIQRPNKVRNMMGTQVTEWDKK